MYTLGQGDSLWNLAVLADMPTTIAKGALTPLYAGMRYVGRKVGLTDEESWRPLTRYLVECEGAGSVCCPFRTS
jgi:hypothetical protein